MARVWLGPAGVDIWISRASIRAQLRKEFTRRVGAGVWVYGADDFLRSNCSVAFCEHPYLQGLIVRRTPRRRRPSGFGAFAWRLRWQPDSAAGCDGLPELLSHSGFGHSNCCSTAGWRIPSIHWTLARYS